MTKKIWTALVATSMTILLLLAVSLAPVPFVIRSPGPAMNLLAKADNKSPLQVSGAQIYETSGKMLVTSVAWTKPDQEVTLPQVFIAYLRPAYQVMRREIVYPIAKQSTEMQADEVKKLAIARRDAVVAALIEAGLPVHPQPIITHVASSGPAYGKLQPGDLIASVNGTVVEKKSQVQELIGQLDPGTVAKLGIHRDGKLLEFEITTVASQDNPHVAKIGIEAENSYQHSVQVNFNTDDQSVGNSGGLALALAVYDELTPQDLIHGRTIAAAGIVSASGEVSSVKHIRQRVRSAELAEADIMLVPESSCAELEGMSARIKLVRVTKLSDAILSLQLLDDPKTADQVPLC